MIGRDHDLRRTMSWNRSRILPQPSNMKIPRDVRKDVVEGEVLRGIIEINQFVRFIDPRQGETILSRLLECLAIQIDRVQHLRQASNQQTLARSSMTSADQVLIIQAVDQDDTLTL